MYSNFLLLKISVSKVCRVSLVKLGPVMMLRTFSWRLTSSLTMTWSSSGLQQTTPQLVYGPRILASRPHQHLGDEPHQNED